MRILGLNPGLSPSGRHSKASVPTVRSRTRWCDAPCYGGFPPCQQQEQTGNLLNGVTTAQRRARHQGLFRTCRRDQANQRATEEHQWHDGLEGRRAPAIGYTKAPAPVKAPGLVQFLWAFSRRSRVGSSPVVAPDANAASSGLPKGLPFAPVRYCVTLSSPFKQFRPDNWR